MPFTSWKEHREGSAVTYLDTKEKLLEVYGDPENPFISKELVDQMSEPEGLSVVRVEEHPDGTDPYFRLNEMSEADLLKIKGIGPKTAQKILAQLPVTSLDKMTLSKSVATTLRLWLSK